MSRIESGRVKIEEKEVHLPYVMHDLRTIVNANIVSKNIEFFIDAVDVDNEDILCDVSAGSAQPIWVGKKHPI